MKKCKGPLNEKRSLERKGNNVGARPKRNILRSKRKLKRDVAKAKKRSMIRQVHQHGNREKNRKGFLRRNIVAVIFVRNGLCIHH